MIKLPTKADKSAGTHKDISQIKEERNHLLCNSKNFFLREAYKTLRTNVVFSLTGEEACKIIEVTSSMQSEGKSFSASNLAITFAGTDARVLLIDCDMRRPKLAKLFRITAETGLSNVLMNLSLLRSSIHPSGVPHLDVLLSGEIPPNPSELLASPRMDRLLTVLRDNYDYIILDTPPVNVVTDALVLAPKTDGVLFVVRSMITERGSLNFAMDQLTYSKAKILGFVLNGVDLDQRAYGTRYRYKQYSRYKRYGYGYGKGYGYGYGYGYEHTPKDRTETH